MSQGGLRFHKTPHIFKILQKLGRAISTVENTTFKIQQLLSFLEDPHSEHPDLRSELSSQLNPNISTNNKKDKYLTLLVLTSFFISSIIRDYKQ